MINTNADSETPYDMRNKIVLVGLANAGKTSIYIRCFDNADHVRIRNLTPTILFTTNKPKITFTEEFIEFIDLGGQKQYIKHHLENPSQFRNLRTVIFVVDVQEVSKLGAIKPWDLESHEYRKLMRFCRKTGIPVHIPFHKLKKEHKQKIIEGSQGFFGVRGFFKWLESKSYKMHVRVYLSRYRGYFTSFIQAKINKIAKN